VVPFCAVESTYDVDVLALTLAPWVPWVVER
jgi:hypothetical protein